MVNGRGVAVLAPSGDGRSYRIKYRDLPALAGMTAGGIWPRSGIFLAQAYRHPYAAAESAAARGSAAQPGGAAAPAGGAAGRQRALFVVDGEAAAEFPDLGDGPLGRALAEGWELLGLFPAAGSWLAQLRRESAEGVGSLRLALSDPLAPGPEDAALSAAAFEARLRPRPLGAGGESGAVAAAAPDGAALAKALADFEGTLIVRLRDAEGGDAWFARGGRGGPAGSAEAIELAAFRAADGRLAVLSRDGELRLGGSGPTARLGVEPPLRGASFVAIAAAGGLAACAWEAGTFPEIAAAGIVVLPLPR